MDSKWVMSPASLKMFMAMGVASSAFLLSQGVSNLLSFPLAKLG